MRTAITFVLNGCVVDISGAEPTTTLLQWLRRVKHLCGTKEGCAEGDCGACTVVIGRRNGDGEVGHAAVNACLQLLPMLEGSSVTTVEGVASADGRLHPCQRAMVDAHASQCGFCTPGFVMSLYAMYLNRADVPAGAAIDATLGGNLCRCTGYGPIVTAAQDMFAQPRPDDEVQRRARENKLLGSIAHDETVCVEGEASRMILPTTEDELAAVYLAQPEATLVAGATDMGLWITKQGRSLPILIGVGRVGGFAALSRAKTSRGERVRLGAGLTHGAAAQALGADVPALWALWQRFAGEQVRNVGTIGGNIANGSPIGDLAPALIALGARLHLRRGDERREVAIEDFFVAYGKQDRKPGEFVTAVEVDLQRGVRRDFSCHKISKRFDDDISAVCGAFNICVDGGMIGRTRIAFGGMAGVPKRATMVEAALQGKPWSEDSIVAAMPAFERDFAPIGDVRASAHYRMQVAKNLLLRTFLERTQRESTKASEAGSAPTE